MALKRLVTSFRSSSRLFFTIIRGYFGSKLIISMILASGINDFFPIHAKNG